MYYRRSLKNSFRRAEERLELNTKKLVAIALLVGMGTVLHAVVPGFALGMKPDMMLTMMFLGIILFPDKKSVLLLGLTTGIISGITSSFPGGLFPNIIDKFVTAFIFLALFLVFSKIQKSIVSVAILTAIGTLISGTVFLGSAYFLVGFPIRWYVCSSRFTSNSSEYDCNDRVIPCGDNRFEENQILGNTNNQSIRKAYTSCISCTFKDSSFDGSFVYRSIPILTK